MCLLREGRIAGFFYHSRHIGHNRKYLFDLENPVGFTAVTFDENAAGGEGDNRISVFFGINHPFEIDKVNTIHHHIIA